MVVLLHYRNDDVSFLQFSARDPIFRLSVCSLHDIYENYRVITLIYKKNGNLSLCLENYALFSLPPIFTKNIYTYTVEENCSLGGSIISRLDNGAFVGLIYELLVFS